MNVIDTAHVLTHTALCHLNQSEPLLLIARSPLSTTYLALASAVAVAAGNSAPSPHGHRWRGPVVFLSTEWTTGDLAATASKLNYVVGTPAADTLTLIGSDNLEAHAFPPAGDSLTVDRYEHALKILLHATGAKLAVLDFPNALQGVVAMALAARELNVVTLATTSQVVDRPEHSVFKHQVLLDQAHGSPVLHRVQPGNGLSRSVVLLAFTD